MEDKPCCVEAAARKTKQLVINGIPIGLSQLEEVIGVVMIMGLESDTEIGDTLLKRIKVFNYVPSSASSEYKNALLDEYHRRVRK
jgi:hypothetical protein